ncbi:hypothetical protein HBE96_15360 [Clostridium sp. P21]|uniref:Uncharacterized protein n=1 Tax=Clostridium muellerianum TaxID=2716538 RepID=A0A7Y0EII7_9CLOT|nr:hypothetical protein [Clostridium muellerianum]NMM64026.1 hypothetical protein [Clostridium muellerianum]
MKKKYGLLSKFIKIYRNSKKKQISILDNKKENMKIQLEEELSKFNNLSNLREKYKKENEKYNEMYNSLMEILKSRGILFNIHNDNFKLKEWDKLSIKKVNEVYVLTDKNGQPVHNIEKKYNNTIKYITDNYSYSLTVIRKDGNLVKAQLRILEKTNLK